MRGGDERGEPRTNKMQDSHGLSHLQRTPVVHTFTTRSVASYKWCDGRPPRCIYFVIVPIFQ